MLADLAAEHAWIRVHERPEADREESLADGRRKARDLDGFLLGAAPLRDDVDVIVKVDADIDFDPDYFAELIGRFAADPKLAIASGTCYELEEGEWVRRTKAESTVWGATRAYRSDCLADVMALEPCMGWDGLDEISVQLRGLPHADLRRPAVPPPPARGRPRAELAAPGRGARAGRLVHGLPADVT